MFFDASGMMYLCMMARHISYDIFASNCSIKEGQKYILEDREKKRKLIKTDKCYRCDARIYCRYCPGQFLLATGSEYIPIIWNCDYAKRLRKRILCNIS